jgi:TRAP-type C4-dicarboxylate transport system permease small subunit
MEKLIMRYEKSVLKWAVPVMIFPILAMSVIETLNVLGRKLYVPFPCSVELVESLLVLCVYFGVSIVAMAGGHVSITLATEKFPQSVQKFLDAFANFLGVLIFGFLACGAWAQFVKAYRILEIRTGVYRFPIWPFRLFFAVGLTMLTIQLVINMIKLTHIALGHKNYADMEKLLKREELKMDEDVPF